MSTMKNSIRPPNQDKKLVTFLYLKDLEPRQRKALLVPFIIHDAELGRREIYPGVGEIQICVGHHIRTDPLTGKRTYEPAYRTQQF